MPGPRGAHRRVHARPGDGPAWLPGERGGAPQVC